MEKYKQKFHQLAKPLSRREALRIIGTATAAGLIEISLPALSHSSSMNIPERPNILFILGDNHNAEMMGCAGHPFIKTPGMDRLAREGIRFENAFNTTPLCSPSRASFLTGVYAHKHGVRNNHTPWTGRMTTFLEHLSRSGYSTAFIGKWHMPGEGLPEMPFLDQYVSYTYREGQGAYFNCPMIVKGKEVPSRKPYITEEITDYAIEFVEENLSKPSNHRKPFCIYLSHRPGHPPFKAPEDISGIYDRADVKKILPGYVDPLWYGKTNGNVFQGVMMGSYYSKYRKYCETLTAMDRDIVRLLDKIDELGLKENTIVIYMGDNGMQWGTHDCHGIREPYEDSIKLPFVVRAPWLIHDQGAVRKHMALNIDLAPTLLDISGVPIPPEMDGISLAPIFSDRGTKGRESFLLEFWRYFPENTPTYFGVRTESYKYIEFERGRTPWLFDLKKDPLELKNIYGASEGEKISPLLKDELESLKSQARS